MSDKEHEIPVKVIDRRWWANIGEAPLEDTRGSGKPTYVESLVQQIAEKDRQIQEYVAKYRQASNEFEEARLRLRREISKDVERSRRDILSEFLEVLDNLDRAVDAARGAGSSDALLQGITGESQKLEQEDLVRRRPEDAVRERSSIRTVA